MLGNIFVLNKIGNRTMYDVFFWLFSLGYYWNCLYVNLTWKWYNEQYVFPRFLEMSLIFVLVQNSGRLIQSPNVFLIGTALMLLKMEIIEWTNVFSNCFYQVPGIVCVTSKWIWYNGTWWLSRGLWNCVRVKSKSGCLV